MAADDTSTINQLMELFLLSRKRGEWVKLSLESKDGKDSVNFSLGSPTGSPVGQPKTWTPGPASPWTWPPLPTWTRPVRRKTPSQWKRDEQRRKDFYAKKGAKVMKTEPSDNQNADVIMEEPADESDLSNIKEVQQEAHVDDMFKILGEFKNPNFQPWNKVEPDKEVKILWEILTRDNKAKGIEEIGEGSTCFEHCFEFWGTWKLKREGITLDFLKNSENWPKGVKIREVKPA